MSYENPWYYNNEIYDEPDEKYVGFVYLITNTETGKMYIGKKNLNTFKYSVKTVVVKSGAKKGQKVKKKTKIVIPSDWKDYYGSSDSLKADVEKQGKSKFSRTILRLCTAKAEMSYYEIKEQLVRDVLLNENYYNSWVSAKIHKAHMIGKKKE